jgi:cell fate regulator YaaT (PSP1 superfamily)
MEYRLDTDSCGAKKKSCGAKKLNKLNTFDWLCDLSRAQELTDWVEVQFKNTRKGYYLNSNKISLEKGDIVAVESSPGHDIGVVALTGALVLKQMRKNNYRFDQHEPSRIYRKARPVDMEKFHESKAREHETMLKSRKISEDLKLDMKIGDVEYQGDGNKAIFYYIADDRVDFRQLIKVLADTFKVRIEMKQIGARQEAGRIGGVGPCGRELCCSSWMTNFVSVSTSAARYQDLSLNPQKLAGQCAKLKCCLNYEIDTYVESSKDIPSKEVPLETRESNFYLFKVDILKRMMTYSTSKDFLANEITITVSRAKQIIQLNKKGIKVESLSEEVEAEKVNEFGDILSQDGLTRFDKNAKPNKNKKSNPQTSQNRGNRPTEFKDRKPNIPQGKQENRDNRDNKNNQRPGNYENGGGHKHQNQNNNHNNRSFGKPNKNRIQE